MLCAMRIVLRGPPCPFVTFVQCKLFEAKNVTHFVFDDVYFEPVNLQRDPISGRT